MQKIILYRYTRPDGGITTSPIKPNCEYTESYRLVADEGKVLQNGDTITCCVDTDTPSEWVEVDAPEEELDESSI
jgi:hypothetical protein